MGRKEEILNYLKKQGCENEELIERTVEEMIYLEEKMKELKGLPFIEVHPQNRARQRATPAAKMYKEFLQQYTNIIKILQRNAGQGESEDGSPLEEWWKRVRENGIEGVGEKNVSEGDTKC